MKTLAKYHVCNHCVIGEKIFKNILIGPGKLPGPSRKGPQARIYLHSFTNNKSSGIFHYFLRLQVCPCVPLYVVSSIELLRASQNQLGYMSNLICFYQSPLR